MVIGSDPFDLQRLLDAQAGVYDMAQAELRAGHKRSHWMWFVFPQLAGLGSSPTAVRYAIAGAEEALACLQHPVLGARVVECSEAVLAVRGRSAHDIFASPGFFERAVIASRGDVSRITRRHSAT